MLLGSPRSEADPATDLRTPSGGFAKFRNHWLTKNASWIMLGQGINFFVQAAYFVLLARLLRVTEYGVFAGAFALVNIATPYSALGAGVLFMRYVSKDRTKAGVYWGNALLTTVLVTFFIAALLMLIGPRLTKSSSPLLILQLVLANCLFSQVSVLASRVFQTYERMKFTSIASLLSSVARLCAVLIMQGTMHHATASQWSLGLLISSAVVALISLVWVKAVIGPFSLNFRLIYVRAVEGLGFSFAGTTQALYNDVDKTMLGHYGFVRDNGLYTLAYRVVDFATTPVGAIDTALLPRLFHVEKQGFAAVVRLAVKSTRTAMIVGIAVAGVTWMVAPLVPHLVGKDYTGVLSAIRWLCLLPFFRSIHLLMGGALTATGRQSLRTASQFSVAALNLGLNIWLIPGRGWIGAAWSSLVCDGLLAVANTSLLVLVSRGLIGSSRLGNSVAGEP